MVEFLWKMEKDKNFFRIRSSHPAKSLVYDYSFFLRSKDRVQFMENSFEFRRINIFLAFRYNCVSNFDFLAGTGTIMMVSCTLFPPPS